MSSIINVLVKNNSMALQVIEIIDRLKALLGARSDSALGRKLGIAQTTVAGWRGRGSISAGSLARIASRVGRSIEWVATGRETAATKGLRDVQAAYGATAARVEQLERLKEGLMDLPFPAFDVAEEFFSYIEDATPEDQETIRRLLKGLRASSDVHRHLVGQLKLIERLIEAEQPPREDEAADPPPRAQAG